MESHDEERLMYKNIQYGSSSGGYNVKDTATALKRNELDAAFFFTLPGPKMIWQFGELGYDYSINYCQNGTINNSCRTDPKPIRWDYLQNSARKELHDVYSNLIKLRFNTSYRDAFISNTSQQSLSGAFKWITLSGTTGKIVVVGNFDVVSQTGSVTFPNAGIWYDYLNGTTISATGASQSFTLAAGEYHVYTNTLVTLPVTLVNFKGKNNGANNILTWTVENEEGLGYYELQRSTDGQNFSFVAKANATGNNSYSFTDNVSRNLSSLYYYRLKIIDKDGKFKYSGVVKIKLTSKGLFTAIRPNPFADKLIVTVESALTEKATLTLTDISGRQLYKQNKTLFAGTNLFEINEAGSFTAGTYILTIADSQHSQNIKVIKTSN